VELLFMVAGTALVWLPVTLLTPPVDRGVLKQFYAKVQPPGLWRKAGISSHATPGWSISLAQWVVGTAALLATTIGPLQLMLGEVVWGGVLCAVACVGWGSVLFTLTRARKHKD
jgi:hypothetical protein